jgi:hypothetical protein
MDWCTAVKACFWRFHKAKVINIVFVCKRLQMDIVDYKRLLTD